MPHRGGHEKLERVGVPDGAGPGVVPVARDVSRDATMPFMVEVARQATRPRTRWTLGLLAALPLLIALAFQLGSNEPGRRRAPGLVDLATAGAANFTLFTLFASTGFFLVVVVALFCGDTIASEASWRSLRYLLTIPVDRGHLLWRKLLVALSYCGFALVMLPVLALLVGGVFFGWAPARTPLGTSLDAGTFLWRLVICVVYIAVSLLSVAALAFLLGVWTDAPLGAVGGAVLVVIVSNILDSITSLGSWRVILPTHYAYAWLDALSPALAWGEMLRGGLWSLTYALALTIAAWWHFLRKDIVS